MLKSAQIAAIIDDSGSHAAAVRLARILDFLGIASQRFKDTSDFIDATAIGSLRGMRYSILAPLNAVRELAFAMRKGRENGQAALDGVHSLFSFITTDTLQCSELLQELIAYPEARLAPIEDERIDVTVSRAMPALTGPMHGLRCAMKARSSDRVLVVNNGSSISRIVESPAGVSFFSFECGGLRTFVVCTSRIPDINEPLTGRWYDVRDHFLSTVPLLMYLKWAFRDVCWQSYESGACLIIDDPVLKTKYGFCDFPKLDAQMQEHSFTTNVAVIPWNWRRTSAAMAELIRDSAGRLSVSVHGCDHTRGEFGTRELPRLNRKVGLAKQRMEGHRTRNGIDHDLIMIFPQGLFSAESLGVLQQNQFVAAVNTELLPVNSEQEMLTIRDAWNVAIVNYKSFPLFTRRYPSHGLENFAFDLLLGKPCLIVEHHAFFKDGGKEASKFIDKLNSINGGLRWRSLGEVIKRSYQWRIGSDEIVDVRMYANELLLTNESDEERSYRIQKVDRGSASVKEIIIGGMNVEWQSDASFITFNCKLAAGGDVLIQVRYHPSPASKDAHYPVTEIVKVALRRYLSEFRDNFLSSINIYF